MKIKLDKYFIILLSVTRVYTSGKEREETPWPIKRDTNAVRNASEPKKMCLKESETYCLFSVSTEWTTYFSSLSAFLSAMTDQHRTHLENLTICNDAHKRARVLSDPLNVSMLRPPRGAGAKGTAVPQLESGERERDFAIQLVSAFRPGWEFVQTIRWKTSR